MHKKRSLEQGNLANVSKRPLLQFVFDRLICMRQKSEGMRGYWEYTPFRNKRDNLWVWLFYSHFWGIFCQPYRYLSQTFGADGHFEVLNMSKSQLDQKLKAKMQIILFLFFFNFGRKNHENLWLINANFLTIFGHFLAN